MLIATWIVTFVIIVGIGVWSGTKIKKVPTSGRAVTRPWAP